MTSSWSQRLLFRWVRPHHYVVLLVTTAVTGFVSGYATSVALGKVFKTPFITAPTSGWPPPTGMLSNVNGAHQGVCWGYEATGVAIVPDGVHHPGIQQVKIWSGWYFPGGNNTSWRGVGVWMISSQGLGLLKTFSGNRIGERDFFGGMS